MKTTDKDHAALAHEFNKDAPRVDWHDETLWWVRQKRDSAVKKIPEWEELREAGSQIKNNVLANLSGYLEQFEANAEANGVHVHWAIDAKEHNEIVLELLRSNSIKKIVKSKSMLTEECDLNEYLSLNGIDVIDSDLGEFIVQLANEHPSHIVLPCIHKKKGEIGELFHRYLGTPSGNSDPVFLTETARRHLRESFLTRKAALTGVNFAVAETGEFVVCTNEGNAIWVRTWPIYILQVWVLKKLYPKESTLGYF